MTMITNEKKRKHKALSAWFQFTEIAESGNEEENCYDRVLLIYIWI